jgi:hypothetical protein
MSTLANQDPQQDNHLTIGLDQRLALARVTPLDSEFWSEESSQFLPGTFQTIRNFTRVKVDILPQTGTANAPFGQFVTFKYGQEGFPNLYGAELHFTLPKLVNAAAANAHPLDTGYGGGVTDYIEWLPYIAEQLYCGREPVRHRFSTETLRSHTADGLHIKRALHMDTEGTQKRAAYNNGVGAIADAANQVVRYRIAVWLPHAVDEVSKKQILPVQAFGQEFQLTFKMPTLLQCIRTNIATPGTNIVVSPTGSVPQVFMRLLYLATEKAERGTFANQVLSAQGLTYMTMHIARETVVTTTGSVGAVTVTIPIKNFQNPSVSVHWIVRITDDLKAAGDTATHQDTNSPIARSSAALVVQRPDQVRFLPWDAYCFFDGGNRITSKRGQDDWQNSTIDGHTCFYPGDFSTNIGSHTFSEHPTVENHGLGHFSFTACNNPMLKIDLPALPAAESNTLAVRQVDCFSFEHNKCYMSNGNMIRVFNVLD